MRRIIKWTVLVVIVGGFVSLTALAVVYWPKATGTKYLTVPVTVGRVETVVNSTGKVKPVKSVSISAFASGQIKLYVDFNSKVKSGYDADGNILLMVKEGEIPFLAASLAGLAALPLGQGPWTSAAALSCDKTLMAEIDPRLLTATMKRDRATLSKEMADQARVQALLDQAVRELRRAERLRKINVEFMSDNDFDEKSYKEMSTREQLGVSRASVEVARANLENSEANLTYTQVWSTENGVIIERKVDPGQVLRSDFQATEVFVIGAEIENHMHIHASVDEADIGAISTAYEKQQRLSQSSPVSFTVDAYPGELFQGKIFQIRNNTTTEQNVTTYPVVIETPNPGGKLRPNMTATITFNIDAKDNVVRLPVAALRYIPTKKEVRPEDQHYLDVTGTTGGAKRSVTEKVDLAQQRQNRIVWIQDGEYLRAVRVTLGLVDRMNAELLGGELNVDQKVVTGIDTTFK